MQHYDNALVLCQVVLSQDDRSSPIQRERIAQVVDQMLPIAAPAGGVDRDALIRDLETRFQIAIDPNTLLEDRVGHVPWLDERRSRIRWQFWDRYRIHLAPKMPEPVLREMDRSTDQVLSKIEDPERDGPWDRRGLIMGHVQSGKTSHYIGLICKAADAGYKVIIVLAGMHNNLRSQTQIRLDEGFVGFKTVSLGTGAMEAIGVGRIDRSLRTSVITNRTDSGDFNMAVARNFAVNPDSKPLLFVVKKNASVLRNLAQQWIPFVAGGNQNPLTLRPLIPNVPLLVIDDEADHGSVDTREGAVDEHGMPDEDHNPTRLNELIRQILGAFQKAAYIGYTATPFANIFIPERARTHNLADDLFPRSFIVNLKAPSNYIGPARVFGLDADPEREAVGEVGLPLVRHIDDHVEGDGSTGWMPPRHKARPRTRGGEEEDEVRVGHTPRYRGEDRVPPSLRQAVRAFVLACCARRARGQHPEHNSMLVHVTRFTTVQHHVHAQVLAEVDDMRNRVRGASAVGTETEPLLEALESLWLEDFAPTSEAVRATTRDELSVYSWSEVKAHLRDVLEAIRVREINGSAGDVLDYEEHQRSGLCVIAIGGDKLARGLTLEGLTVSYFLRATRMYDTLMQMGRWFGYRPGHYDLCRLYMTAELEEWYGHIANASEELRREFDHMASVGGTPMDYGLKVQAHPVLTVTSRVKMRHRTTLSLSYAGSLTETTVFHRDRKTTQDNYRAALAFIASLGVPTEQGPSRARPNGKVHTWKGARVWADVPSSVVINLLTALNTHPDAITANGRLIADYVSLQNRKPHNWHSATHQYAPARNSGPQRPPEPPGPPGITHWTVALMSAEGADAPGLPSNVGPVKCIERNWKTDALRTGPRYVIRRLLSPRDEAIDLGLEEYADALAEAAAQASGGTAPEFPSGPQLRARRDPRRALLLIYLLDWHDTLSKKAQLNGDVLPPAAVRVDGERPVVGIGISFPGDLVGGEVVYEVNNVYYNQEFGVSDGDDDNV